MWTTKTKGRVTIKYQPSKKYDGRTQYKVEVTMSDGSKLVISGGHTVDLNVDAELEKAQKTAFILGGTK